MYSFIDMLWWMDRLAYLYLILVADSFWCRWRDDLHFQSNFCHPFHNTEVQWWVMFMHSTPRISVIFWTQRPYMWSTPTVTWTLVLICDNCVAVTLELRARQCWSIVRFYIVGEGLELCASVIFGLRCPKCWYISEIIKTVCIWWQSIVIFLLHDFSLILLLLNTSLLHEACDFEGYE